MAETHQGLFGHFLYADAPPDVADKNAAIAAQPGVGCVVDGRDDIRFKRVVANNLDFDMLRRASDVTVGGVVGTFRFAPAEAEDVGEAGSLQPLDLVEGAGDGFAFERFDIGFDFFHGIFPLYFLIGIDREPLVERGHDKQGEDGR